MQKSAPVNSGRSSNAAAVVGAPAPPTQNQHQCKDGKDKQDLSVKFHLIQRQLVLVLHAQRCTAAACLLPNCDVMKDVLRHLTSCTNTGARSTETATTKCPFQFCFSTRQIITHWRNCGGKCDVCVSVQRIINSTKRKSGGGSPPPAYGPKKKRHASISSSTPLSLGARFGPFNVKLWDLELEWGRPAGGVEPKTYTKISLPCQVFSHAAGGGVNVTPTRLHMINFTPTRLHMKLIPSSILHKLGVMQNVRPLRFQFGEQAPGLAELTEAMKSGHYCGYVHIECDSAGAGGGGFKLLILHYNAPSGEFMGYKPTNQQEFIDKLKAIVETERDRVVKPQEAFLHNSNNLNNEGQGEEAKAKKIWSKTS